MGHRAVIAGCCVALAFEACSGCSGLRLRRGSGVEPSAQTASAEDLSHEATAAMDRKDFAQAQADLELLLKQTPNSAELHCRLGKVLQFQDRPTDAEAEYKTALKLDPHYVGALVGLGQVDARLDRPQDALIRFEKAIEVDPHQAEAHLARGRTLEVLHRPKDALAAYFRSLELDPTLSPAMVRAAVLQYDRGRWDQALVRLDQANELAPGDAETHYRRGLTLIALMRPKPAILDLSFAAQHAPDRAEILVGLARALEADRQPDKARLALEEALRLQPQLPIARDLSERLLR